MTTKKEEQPAAEVTQVPVTTEPMTVYTAQPTNVAVMPGFTSHDSWELAQRIAKAFASSTLVPQQYRDNIANCIIALEMANRMGASPMMVMQNLYIVHGNPGWSSKFLIATFNQCGRYTSLRYEWDADRKGCRAWAIEKRTNERIEGPKVTMDMAKAEGWSEKAGSKWKSMPEMMLMYRSAAMLIRVYAPEISMGLSTADEAEDMGPQQTHSVTAPSAPALRFTAQQMAQAKAEIAEGVTTAEVIAERFPALHPDQLAEIHSYPTLATA